MLLHRHYVERSGVTMQSSGSDTDDNTPVMLDRKPVQKQPTNPSSPKTVGVITSLVVDGVSLSTTDKGSSTDVDVSATNSQGQSQTPKTKPKSSKPTPSKRKAAVEVDETESGAENPKKKRKKALTKNQAPRKRSNSKEGSRSASIDPLTNQASQPKSTSQSPPPEDPQDTQCTCGIPYDEVTQPFMIQCENCDVWYHGTCVKIDAIAADDVDRFYCKKCNEENPDLLIQFTSTAVAAGRVQLCATRGCQSVANFPISKYCTRACGLSTARNTIRKLLRHAKVPDTYKGTSDCNDNDVVSGNATREYLQDIDKTKMELEFVNSRVEELMAERNLHQRNIDHAKTLTPQERNDSENIDGDPSSESTRFTCFLCPHKEGPPKMILTHMIKCSRKQEQEVSICAPKPTEVPNCPINAFCNAFDRSTKQYCRRYHALCPEHNATKKFKLGKASSVCGYPSTADGSVCLLTKGECVTHIGWESFRTARLELEIVQQCMYRNYLQQQVEELTDRLTRKYTVMTSIFTSTVTHNQKEADAIAQRAMELAGSASVSSWKDSVGRDSRDGDIGLTGGSLGLPKRFWR